MPSGSSRYSPEYLREVIEAAGDVPVMTTRDGRDAVLMLLPQAWVSAIPRGAMPKVDIGGMVFACANYPDGLVELRDAINFYDGGSTAVVRFNFVIAKRHPDKPEEPGYDPNG
jgi:hypothetical protein